MDDQELFCEIRALLEDQDEPLRDRAPLLPVSAEQLQGEYQSHKERFEVAMLLQEPVKVAYEAVQMIIAATGISLETMQQAIDRAARGGIERERVIPAILTLLKRSPLAPRPIDEAVVWSVLTTGADLSRSEEIRLRKELREQRRHWDG